MKKLLNFPFFLVFSVIIFAVSITVYSEAQRSRIAIQRLVDAIEPALAQSLLKSNYLGLNETARALVASQVDSIKIHSIDSANISRMVWSFPNLLRERDICAIRFDADIRFQGLLVGNIESCFEPQSIFKRAILSASTIVFFIILSGVILTSGAIGNLRLKRKIIAFSNELEEWGKRAILETSIPELKLGTSDVEKRLGRHTKNLIEELISSKIRSREHEAIANTTQNLAHDVRKPFSMLKMVLEAVSDSEDPHESREIAKASLPEVNQAMASVEGMIQDVMQIGSNSKPNQEVASPEAIIDGAVNELFRIFPEADVGIEYNLKHQHSLFIDTMRVGRVFSNILVNAVQAMNSKGNLWIKTNEEKGFVEFRLGNMGSCIPKESLPKLFEAFFTSGKKGGTGLGLAIAQKVVNEHGGSIRCESDKTEVYPAGYVEFIFTLPISSDINPKREEPLPNHSRVIQEQLLKLKKKDSSSTSIDELEQEKIITKRLKTLSSATPPILIVDDEAVYRNSLGGLLTNFRGGESELAKIPVVFAKNADEAMALSKQHKPFLVIQDIDLGISSKNGIEVIKDMRKEGYKGRICVHSNRFLFDDQKTAMEAGADSVLPKPMSRAHLFKLISSSLPEESKQKTQNIKPKNTENTKPRIAYIDDAITFTLSWKFKLKDKIDIETFSSSTSFLKKTQDEPDFLDSLDVIVTDYYFGPEDPFNGKSFAAELRQLGFEKPIYLASNGDFNEAEFKPELTGVIGKDVPSFETVMSWIIS